MTVIIAVDFFTEICILSDTRVSYQDRYDTTKGLNKVFPIISPNMKIQACLGFAGDVSLAQKIFRFLFKDNQYNDKLSSIADLRDYIKDGIEHVITDKRKFNDKRLLSFVLCALHADERRFSNLFNQSQIYSYEVSMKKEKKEEIVSVTEQKHVAVIGSGDVKIDKIKKIREQIINTQIGGDYDSVYLDRTWSLLRDTANIYDGWASVGGAFQIITMKYPISKSWSLWRWLTSNPIAYKDISVSIIKDDFGEELVFFQDETTKFAIEPIWHPRDWQSSGNYSKATG